MKKKENIKIEKEIDNIKEDKDPDQVKKNTEEETVDQDHQENEQLIYIINRIPKSTLNTFFEISKSNYNKILIYQISNFKLYKQLTKNLTTISPKNTKSKTVLIKIGADSS